MDRLVTVLMPAAALVLMPGMEPLSFVEEDDEEIRQVPREVTFFEVKDYPEKVNGFPSVTVEYKITGMTLEEWRDAFVHYVSFVMSLVDGTDLDSSNVVVRWRSEKREDRIWRGRDR